MLSFNDLAHRLALQIRSCETNCPWALAIYREDAGKMIQPRPRAYAEGEGEMTFTARVSAARD